MYAQQYNAPAALDTAVVVKLVRNLCMAGVIPLFAIMHRRRSYEGNGSVAVAAPKWHQYVPLFVLGFVLMVVIRSAVDWSQARNGWPNVEAWNSVLGTAGTIAIWCLAIAMASVGLHTGLSRLRKLGLRPFTIGFAAAVLVGGVSVVLVKLLGPMIH